MSNFYLIIIRLLKLKKKNKLLPSDQKNISTELVENQDLFYYGTSYGYKLY